MDFPFYFWFACRLIASSLWLNALLVGAKAQASSGPDESGASPGSSQCEVPGTCVTQQPVAPDALSQHPALRVPLDSAKVSVCWEGGHRLRRAAWNGVGLWHSQCVLEESFHQVSGHGQVRTGRLAPSSPLWGSLSEMPSSPFSAASQVFSWNRAMSAFPACINL